MVGTCRLMVGFEVRYNFIEPLVHFMLVFHLHVCNAQHELMGVTKSRWLTWKGLSILRTNIISYQVYVIVFVWNILAVAFFLTSILLRLLVPELGAAVHPSIKPSITWRVASNTMKYHLSMALGAILLLRSASWRMGRTFLTRLGMPDSARPFVYLLVTFVGGLHGDWVSGVRSFEARYSFAGIQLSCSLVGIRFTTSYQYWDSTFYSASPGLV